MCITWRCGYLAWPENEERRLGALIMDEPKTKISAMPTPRTYKIENE